MKIATIFEHFIKLELTASKFTVNGERTAKFIGTLTDDLLPLKSQFQIHVTSFVFLLIVSIPLYFISRLLLLLNFFDRICFGSCLHLCLLARLFLSHFLYRFGFLLFNFLLLNRAIFALVPITTFITSEVVITIGLN